MDAAIIPHVKDQVSKYMDPIKLKMYQAVGLPVFCPTWIACGKNIMALNGVDSIRTWLQTVPETIAGKTERTPSPDAEKYIIILARANPHQ